MYKCVHCDSTTNNRIKHGAMIAGRLVQLTVTADCTCIRSLKSDYKCFVCGKDGDKNRKLVEAEMSISNNRKNKQIDDYVTTTTIICSQECANVVSAEVKNKADKTNTPFINSTEFKNVARGGVDVVFDSTSCYYCHGIVMLKDCKGFCVGDETIASKLQKNNGAQTMHRVCNRCMPTLPKQMLTCVSCYKRVSKTAYHLLDNDHLNIKVYSCDNPTCSRISMCLMMEIGKKLCDKIHVIASFSRCSTKLDKPLWCSRCMGISYCGNTCQKADWPMHKYQCVAISPTNSSTTNSSTTTNTTNTTKTISTQIIADWIEPTTISLTEDSSGGKTITIASDMHKLTISANMVPDTDTNTITSNISTKPLLKTNGSYTKIDALD